MHTELTTIQSVLTRASGFLETVCSHSLQPYRGCPFGASLCGVGCYVQHSLHVTRGRPWGSFLEVRTNAAQAYQAGYERERRWARQRRGGFVIFLSSATEPFPPQESRQAITRSVLTAMLDQPPDGLIVQTHSHRVVDALDVLVPLAGRCTCGCTCRSRPIATGFPDCRRRPVRSRGGSRPPVRCGRRGCGSW